MASALIRVKIHEFQDPGTFRCSPCQDEDQLSYTDILVDLNNHIYKNKENPSTFIPEVGMMVAAYFAVGSDELWYRGKIKQLVQKSSGVMAQVLFIDEDHVAFVSKSRIRSLPDRYSTDRLPQQSMSCVLDEIVPITMGTEPDLRLKLMKTHKWDTSALPYIEKLVKNTDLSIDIKFIDAENVHHVVLWLNDGSVPITNVNQLLVNQNYATEKSTDNLTLKEQSVLVQRKEDENRKKDILPFGMQGLSLKEKRERQKQKKVAEYKKKNNSEMADLLELLGDPAPVDSSQHSSSHPTDSSDQSDLEKSPAPVLPQYKRIQPKRNAEPVIAEKLGNRSAEYLSSRLSASPSNPEKEKKRVSFSSKEEFFDDTSSIVSSTSSRSRLQETSPPKPSSSDINDASPPSKSVGAQFILKTLKIDPSNTRSNDVRQKLSNDEVLVYGKRKHEPFKTKEQLNLPDYFKTTVMELGLMEPSPIHKHLWPAVIAFRDIVGIVDFGTSEESRVLGYFLPILCSMVKREGVYEKVGKGNSPFVIVCVPNWKIAREVYDVCEKLLIHYINRKVIRLDVRYGGMDNIAERNIRLVNGCDILITTVPSLNYVVENNYINLDRLCHVIFDNADKLVESFSEGIISFMKKYKEKLQKLPNGMENCQILAIGEKWSAGMQSLMNVYTDDALVIIANKIEAALYAKVPIIPEICASDDRQDNLMSFIQSEAADENTIVFTNSAKGAEVLHETLKSLSLITNVITEYTENIDLKDTLKNWKVSCDKMKGTILIISDNAISKANIKNATCVVQYDYPKFKSHFGKRLSCVLDTIRENENKDKPKPLFCQIFITEKNNGVRYCTGLVKILKRAGQQVPQLLKSMADSSRELKEEDKQYSQLCGRLKLFGTCQYLEDCRERHTIFKDKDLLGLCPSTGSIKVVILDVISASSFWARIVEHKLNFDQEESAYNTGVYIKLQLDLQMFYADPQKRTLCVNASKYDVCVMHTVDCGYQRVRIEDILKKEYERPKLLQVFGIDNGFTTTVDFNKLYICNEEFLKIPAQAVEVIACCVKPVEEGDSWTHEATTEIANKVRGRTLEGRVQFSLQNTIWVDPLVEKKMLNGIQAKAYALDVGRDLINMGYAQKNVSHVDTLRKLLFDVQGRPMEVVGNKQNLPSSMIDHEVEVLEDNEDVFVSAVEDPGLFFVQRVENFKKIEQLDDKINATMSVKNTGTEIIKTTYPVGYICVAQFSHDQKWYRGQVVGINKDQLCYDIFFVDHGDREWIGKSKVDQCWPDILTLPFQAMECCFTNITPMDCEWTFDDGDALWELCEKKLLSAKVNRATTSTYIPDTMRYEIELDDRTCNVTQNINHELVFMGIARGSLQCLQEMFPHASLNQEDRVYEVEHDKCTDLCVDVYQAEEMALKLEKANELKDIVLRAPTTGNVLSQNGSIESLTKLLALSKKAALQEVILSTLLGVIKDNEVYAVSFEDHDGVKALCEILKATDSDVVQDYAIQLLRFTANDPWSLHVLQQMNFISMLCKILKENKENKELLINVLDSVDVFCKDDETNCTSVRHAEGIDALCHLYDTTTDMQVAERCTSALISVLADKRNQTNIRETGCLQILASLHSRNINEPTAKNIIHILLKCIEDNEQNRDYLHKINAHKNLIDYSKSSKNMSMIARKSLKELINKLAPAPLTDFIITTDNQKIDPGFNLPDDGFIDDQVVTETMAPKTVWSQRPNFVTISICLRGVKDAETSFEENKVSFRTVLNSTEYILELELYSNIRKQDAMVSVKGGEVLVQLVKENSGEIWPRLLATDQKVPYISIDFDRWVEDFTEIEEKRVDDGTILFQPDLPKPPPCTTSYDMEQMCVDEPGLSSSSAEEGFSSDEEDEGIVENLGKNPDYFNI